MNFEKLPLSHDKYLGMYSFRKPFSIKLGKEIAIGFLLDFLLKKKPPHYRCANTANELLPLPWEIGSSFNRPLYRLIASVDSFEGCQPI